MKNENINVWNFADALSRRRVQLNGYLKDSDSPNLRKPVSESLACMELAARRLNSNLQQHFANALARAADARRVLDLAEAAQRRVATRIKELGGAVNDLPSDVVRADVLPALAAAELARSGARLTLSAHQILDALERKLLWSTSRAFVKVARSKSPEYIKAAMKELLGVLLGLQVLGVVGALGSAALTVKSYLGSLSRRGRVKSVNKELRAFELEAQAFCVLAKTLEKARMGSWKSAKVRARAKRPRKPK